MKRLLLAFILGGCVVCAHNTIGDKYIGASYVADPLGEMRAPDTDPLIRTDAFDCTTFVETALANGDVKKLNKIRYKNGKIDFMNRNHFIETEWIPNNSNIVYNASRKYGKTALRHVMIDRASWMRRVHNIESGDAVTEADLVYIPYANIDKIDNTEPLIVLFIVDKSAARAEKIGTDLAVVHMGFLLPGGVLRHASSTVGRVVDEDFYEYISQRRKNKNNLGVTLLGIKND